ncbi:MAG: DegV family protein [Anaerolineaceae bacterium]|nr:DegV family protein [Anaerolineaceae bacterium]
MAKIAIVTDSTAACTNEMIGNVPIISVPLDVVWGQHPLRDGVDISAGDFYEEMKLAEVMPTTSQPSPSAFQEAYRNLINNGYEVLSMHISEGISGTINSARHAAALLDAQDKVVVVDSLVTAMVLKMQILEAAKAVNNGATLKECAAFVQDMRNRCGVFFTVETLDYLERGGRMTRGGAFVGNLLQIRPILTFVDGKIVSIQKARTYKGAVKLPKTLPVISGQIQILSTAANSNGVRFFNAA